MSERKIIRLVVRWLLEYEPDIADLMAAEGLGEFLSEDGLVDIAKIEPEIEEELKTPVPEAMQEEIISQLDLPDETELEELMGLAEEVKALRNKANDAKGEELDALRTAIADLKEERDAHREERKAKRAAEKLEREAEKAARISDRDAVTELCEQLRANLSQVLKEVADMKGDTTALDALDEKVAGLADAFTDLATELREKIDNLKPPETPAEPEPEAEPFVAVNSVVFREETESGITYIATKMANNKYRWQTLSKSLDTIAAVERDSAPADLDEIKSAL